MASAPYSRAKSPKLNFMLRRSTQDREKLRKYKPETSRLQPNVYCGYMCDSIAARRPRFRCRGPYGLAKPADATDITGNVA